MFRSASSVLLLPHWRLAWLLALVLWVAELKQPTTTALSAPKGTVLRIGSTHSNPGPATVLLGQIASNREAITPSDNLGDNGILFGLALLPKLFVWQLPLPAPTRLQLPVRPSAVPDVFRRRLLLTALSPNAP